MPSQEYIDKKKEEFRFFDDLAPEVRKFLREAYYEWDPIPIMSKQHNYYGNGLTMEDLAEDYKALDEERFHSKMKPKLKDEPSTSNG